jgi:hypothetical protein
MATSQYFNHFNSTNEQDLLHDLSMEFISNYGIDLVYLPRERLKEDLIFGESTLDRFSETYELEMYISSTDSFEGEGEVFQQFGIEIKDRVSLQVNPRNFQHYTTMDHPLEGDLIYFPLNDSLFEITYVSSDRSSFYPMGTLPYLELQCELFTYANEEFDTDNISIDDIENITDQPITDYPILINAPVGIQDWKSNHRYSVGDLVHPTANGMWTGLWYKVVQQTGLGMSNIPSQEPSWPRGAKDVIQDHELIWEATGINNEFDTIQTEGNDILNFDELDPFNFTDYT